MKLKGKLIGIETGWTPVVTINKNDAIRYDLHPRDRVLVETVGRKHNRQVIAVVDIGNTSGSIAEGEVGVLMESAQLLHLNNEEVVDIHPAEKPESIKYIKQKMAGATLSDKEFDSIVKDIVAGALTEVEMTYFVSAVSIHSLLLEEVVALTKSIVRNGNTFVTARNPVVDKHCIGGVAGNRTTMVVVPILAAFGFCVPKTSSRAITSPSGTADTMEVLADVSLSLKHMSRVVEKCGACMAWGGSLGLAPADDKIIRIEKPMSIDATGLMLSSVMAKKASVGATHVLIDIPYGKGAKIGTRKAAEELKGHFLTLGKLLGMKLTVLMTDGSQPIGNGIGPVLEAKDVLAVLCKEKHAPQDLREKALLVAAELLEFTGGVKKGAGYEVAKDILDSGSAWRKMDDIIEAQGRAPPFRLGRHRADICSSVGGVVSAIDNEAISKLARMAGAPITQGAGLYLHKKVGALVKKGDSLYTAYADSAEKLRHVQRFHQELHPYHFKES